MVNDRSKLLGPDGLPLSTLPSIVVIKTRQPIPQRLVQAIGATTKSNVVVLPFEKDLIMGKLAMEDIEAIHEAIHKVLKIGKVEEPPKP